MSRLFQLFLALAALGAGLWLLYGGYEREVSLAGKTEMGLVILKTGVDGRTRVLTHHWYYGAGTHENFHGAGLDPHFDFNIHPKTAQHRRINAIVYLNKNWDPSWKGSICFHSDPYDLRGDQVTDA